MANGFNPSTWEAETEDLCEFEVSLVYGASSRTARAFSNKQMRERSKGLMEGGLLCELAHMIMQGEKPPNMLFANWKGTEVTDLAEPKSISFRRREVAAVV